MHRIISFLAGLFLLLVFFAGIGFSILNTTPIGLSLGFREFTPQPVAVWIVAAFASGGLLGLIFGAGIFGYFKNKLEIRRLRKQLTQAQTEVSKLRSHSHTVIK